MHLLLNLDLLDKTRDKTHLRMAAFGNGWHDIITHRRDLGLSAQGTSSYDGQRFSDQSNGASYSQIGRAPIGWSKCYTMEHIGLPNSTELKSYGRGMLRPKNVLSVMCILCLRMRWNYLPAEISNSSLPSPIHLTESQTKLDRMLRSIILSDSSLYNTISYISYQKSNEAWWDALQCHLPKRLAP